MKEYLRPLYINDEIYNIDMEALWFNFKDALLITLSSAYDDNYFLSDYSINLYNVNEISENDLKKIDLYHIYYSIYENFSIINYKNEKLVMTQLCNLLLDYIITDVSKIDFSNVILASFLKHVFYEFIKNEK